MPQTQDLLIEIGTEELPPKALLTLSSAFTEGVVSGLKEASLEAAEVTSYAAPRRLAILLRSIPVKQQDQSVERKGPAKQAAFDADGQPTKAFEGFARSCGVTPAELEEVETPKGVWLVFRQEVAGKSVSELLPDIVNKSLAKLPIPKRMRWGASDIEFVRPVHWVVMMLGAQTINAEILGVAAGNQTHGHRFHHPEAIDLPQAAAYADLLREPGKVIASFESRRDAVRAQAEKAASELGGVAQIDSALLDEVTALIEWPVAVAGSFDSEFLEIPQECLISSMQDHQKYFPVVDGAGRLMPNFITISNIESRNPDVVREGNERVIRPRFSDAKFFWEQDCKATLASRHEATKKIVFQQKLGTLYEKSDRVATLAGFIAAQLGRDNIDKQQAIRAAELSKCDLVTEMVNEFPELQGIMGRYYALNDGEPEAVANAIQEQYQPGFAGDAIPAGEIGRMLSLADKLDTLMGIFAIGMKPTGSKDPFSLRRAALGVLRIIIEGKLDLDLKALLEQAAAGLQEKVDATAAIDDALSYVMERLRAYYQDQGIGPDTVAAVASLKPTRPLDFDQRVRAVNNFRTLEEAEALAAANKRISNIIKKVQGAVAEKVDESLFNEAQEKALYAAIRDQQTRLEPLFASGDYSAALSALATLRKDVDDFFDHVMVMDENEALKNNRLALLSQLRNLFLQIADLSRLQ